MLDAVDTRYTESDHKGQYKNPAIVHDRKPCVALTNKHSYLGDNVLSIVKQYKYLGIVLNEFVDFNVTTAIIAGTANRAIGAQHGYGYNTHAQLIPQQRYVPYYCSTPVTGGVATSLNKLRLSNIKLLMDTWIGGW